ncbi:retrovirus-related pol polyprotein from transposon TNT 1-94 [Tanacetum coccineum]
MAQPMGFIDSEKPNHVYKLKKALYGLKQAPKAWYDRLKAFLIKHEYNMGMVDNTLFTKKKSSNLIIVQIYVDDIIFGSTCQEMCDDFAKIMHDEFEMSMMGELNFFLGLQIKQMEDGNFFNQSKYIKEMLKKFGLEDSKPMKTPMSSDTKLTKDEECESVDSTKYRGMIGFASGSNLLMDIAVVLLIVLTAAIYIQQFWDTICYDRIAGGYKCQLDEQWFNLTKDTLRDALRITPVNNNKAFYSPPTQDTLINFVNDLEHSRQSLICALRERLLGIERQELQCCRFFRASSIDLISIMRKGCGKNSLNPSILSRKTKIICSTTMLCVPGESAKHQRYLAGEEVSDPDSRAPKPAKSTKPKVTKQAKPIAPKAATKKPQPAPTKPKEKKQKQAKETTEVTPPAKRAKAGKVVIRKGLIEKSEKACSRCTSGSSSSCGVQGN